MRASGPIAILPGEYDGPLEPQPVSDPEPVVVFAGRHIPEKRVGAIPPAVLRARQRLPGLRAKILGDGPDRDELRRSIAELGLQGIIEAPGFVATEEVEHHMANAICLLLPSRREGYGMVVIEAAAYGTPSVVVAGPDNAAVELVEDGTNGFIARSASPDDLAAEIIRVAEDGRPLRERTAVWFADNARRHSLGRSLDVVLRVYAGSAAL